jgi:hypothetical protein
MTQSLPTWLIVAVKTSPTVAEHPPLVIVPAAALAPEIPIAENDEVTNAKTRKDMRRRGMRCFSLA